MESFMKFSRSRKSGKMLSTRFYRLKAALMRAAQDDDKSESLRYCQKPAQSTYSSTPQSRTFHNALIFTLVIALGF